MDNANQQKTTMPPLTEQSAPVQEASSGASCPAAPEPSKKRISPAIVTPTVPTKRRRLDEVSSPSPVPVRSNSSRSSTPTRAELYGEEEENSFQSILVPDLHSTHSIRPGTYKRRNSVTKYSVQVAKHMSLLEAARKTIQKMRQENQGKSSRIAGGHAVRSLFEH